MDALVNLPMVFNARDLKAVRQLYDDVEANTRALEALGHKPDEYGELLLPLLPNKIPKEIRLSICKKVRKENWNFITVLDELKHEVENRERCEYVAVSLLNEGQSARRQSQSGNRGPATASALVTGSDQKTGPTCAYCTQPHPSTRCSVVTSVLKRKEILKTSGCCFVCIKRNHISRNCQSRSRCNKCHGRHHSSICGWHEMSTPNFRGHQTTHDQNNDTTADEGTRHHP